ncbi:MAG: hypothetical protein A2X94_17245 [Bdellovibrionales bacterium GWB1_55_8]|nr:MAG: hypothetical protein A2X94_17245 [Bdellovibrionales bacterium GWB1_55_8]
MAIPWRISIRTKILAVLSVLLMSAVGLYLALASRVFYEDKTLLIYELNQNGVRSLGSDVETQLKRAFDKLHILAALSSGDAAKISRQSIDVLALEKSGFVSLGLLALDSRNANKSLKPAVELLASWPKFMEPYSAYVKDPDYLKRLRERVPLPFPEIFKQGAWVRNSTLPEADSPPLMTLAIPFSGTAENGTVLYADLPLSALLEIFSRNGIAQTYLTDSEGYALAHSDPVSITNAKHLRADPLIQAALNSKVRSEMRRFQEGNVTFLGSFFNVGIGGLVVASKTASDEAFTAARLLMHKSVLYAALVVTAVFLVALFFSHSLTVPIERLVEATRRIAQGQFDHSVAVSTRDELAVLANSFNLMTRDLKTSHEKLEEYSRDLEKKVAERTEALEMQNVAIKEAQEALVRTTRLASVGEIAGRAAHEVLNPLTNITTRAEKLKLQNLESGKQDLQLLQEIATAWAREYRENGQAGLLQSLNAPSSAHPGKTLLEEDLENIQAIAADSTNRLNGLQGDLDFVLNESGRISRIVNGMRQLTRVSGNRKQLEAHALLRESLATMQDIVTKHSIATELNLAAGNPLISAEHDELIQVLSNLIRNSMQAIQEARAGGKPVGDPARIWMETSVIGDSLERRLQIRFCDNGPGITAENAERIFEPSFTTKSLQEGTGLGLSICRRFLRAYEGDIILESSEPGTRTVFLIEFPVAEPAEREAGHV